MLFDKQLLAGMAVVGLLATPAAAAENTVPDLSSSYKAAPEWGHLPNGRVWGSTSAVQTAPDGIHMWALDRCGASCAKSTDDPVLLFDGAGKLVAHFGGGMIINPHGLFVDKNNNVWVTDLFADEAAHKGVQVFKFSPEGKLLMTLGKAGVKGDGPDTFAAPADVAVAANGDIFVSDGHVACNCPNSRIMKFSPDGKFIKQWGKLGAGPGEFNDPHSLAIDSKDRLLVADRANNRIQIFDQDGKFIAAWTQFGRPSGLAVDNNDMLYAIDPDSTEEEGYGHNPGFKQGVWVGSAATGKIAGFIPNTVFETGEGVAADKAGNLYYAKVRAKVPGVYKFEKQ